MKKYLATAALIIVIGGVYAVHSYTAKADIYGSSLVGWWRMDSNDYTSSLVFSDRSGNGNSGSLNGGVSGVTGILGQAIKFNSSGFVSTTYTGQLTDFTACAWYYRLGDGQLAAGANRVMDKSYQLGFWMGEEAVVPPTHMGGGIMEGGFPYGIYVAPVPFNNAWHHLCNERSGTTQTITLDGGQQTATQTVPATALDATTLTIGSDDNRIAGFNGYIDDVRIYNRALSPAEIATLWYQGQSQHYNGAF